MHWAQASFLETSVAEVRKNTLNSFSIKLEKGFFSFGSPWLWKIEAWKKLLLEQVSFDCETEKNMHEIHLLIIETVISVLNTSAGLY